MVKINILLILVFLSSITASGESLNYTVGVLDHCIEYNSTENKSICSKCEDKYFLYYFNNSCIACNDSYYGQIGCEGNCDGSNYEKTRFAFCEKGGCKEGYYNLNGLCFNCSIGSPGCAKCTYEVQEEQTEGNFICYECLNDEYKLIELGNCEHCDIPLCEKCHYDEDGNAICDKCEKGTYNNSYGKCQYCRSVYIGYGYCTVCSDNNTDYVSGTCYCYNGYTLIENSKCLSCSDGCEKCRYNSTLNDTICTQCYPSKTLNNDNNCISCGEKDCRYCSFDEKYNTTTCLSCTSGLSPFNNKCISSINSCSSIILDEFSLYKNESICEECYDNNYVLNQNKSCTYCRNQDDTGNGCSRCIYDENEKRYKCLKCYNNYDYVYINNTFECFDNNYIDDKFLEGCIEANYSEATKNYECFKCKEDYIHITNDKMCKHSNYIDLSSNCLKVENLWTVESSLYSCKECQLGYALIEIKEINATIIKDCYFRENNLSYCLEGKLDENGNPICIKCVDHATLNSSGICECDFDYFGKYNKFCYKCDDEIEGNIGCESGKGCNYIHSNDELNCNECKEGYFKYTKGQCYSCNFEIPNCGKCYLSDKVNCQSCIDIYTLNNKSNKCELNECEEYTEISPGCIICKDKLDEYKPKKKCQICKYGYFKTKEETCVYCRAEKYGGPGCYECGYEKNENNEETDNILCINCFSMDKYYNIYDYNDYYNYNRHKYHDYYISVLSSKGKCYVSKYDLSDPCLKYELIKDNNNIEKIVCTICYLGYYLDSNGNCINYVDQIEKLPNCENHLFFVSNFKFYYYPNDGRISFQYYNLNDYLKYFNIINEHLKNMEYPIKSKCQYCNNGYYINDKGECEPIFLENCTITFIIQNLNRRGDSCYNLCYQNDYPFIYLKLIDNSIDYDLDYYNISNIYNDDIRSLYSILGDFNIINDESLKQFFLDKSLCYIPSNDTLNDKFKGCEKLLYIPKTKSFQCIECKHPNELDNENNVCKEIKQIGNCFAENLGTESSPIYSCKTCYSDYYTLITFENGIKYCVYNYYDNLLKNCLSANTTSDYLKPIYNCTSCKANYTIFYSKFYQRIICHNDDDEIKENNKIYLEYFENEPKIPINDDGTCEDNYFTPDKNNCYPCNMTNYIGMPGCKGKCSFSLERNDIILCESGCNDGYIEESKGICKNCSSIDWGCEQCHYGENTYPLGYLDREKARIVICDKCWDGFMLSKNGNCVRHSCSRNCDKCEINDETGEYKCLICSSKDYGLDEYGYCEECIITQTVVDGKCIKCNDINKGGIANCSYCQQNEKGNGVLCKQCSNEYILLTDNNTCIKRENNIELKEFEKCLELKIENNKFICSKCKYQFSLLKEKDNSFKCAYLPTLYDSNFRNYYNFHNYYDIFKSSSTDFYKYLKNDYNFRRSVYFPCEQSVNIGTEENPIYSCIKCFNLYENEKYDYEYYYYYLRENYEYYYFYNYDYDYMNEYYERYSRFFPVKIFDLTKNNISYCILANDNNENCLEANYIILSGKEIYNCTKCRNNYYLLYSRKNNIYYCSDVPINTDEEQGTIIDKEEECLVEYCDICVVNNNYFCSECISSDYEINKIGSCVEKTETIPSVTWKDIFRLNMNDQKEINGQTIIGPSLTLRGITSNQINSRHAFLVYLTFKIKYGLRLLQEDIIKIPAFCQIKNSVNKTDDDINIVDYECIGNNLNQASLDENYQLTGIEEEDNSESIKNADFDKINEIIINEGEKLSQKNDSSYNDKDDIIIFKIDISNKNITSNENHIFNFTLKGKLNKDISLGKNTPYDAKVEMYNTEDIPKSTFYLENDQNARLNIILELKNITKKEKISFFNSEIKVNNNYSIYVPLLTEIELYNYLEDKTEKCYVEFCRICSLGNNYFCAECNNTNYEVNKFTGSCVNKSKVIPLITWKDIYGLNLNGQKEINGKIFKGPFLKLRGITSSQINERHAFSIYLTFRTNQKLRYLQEPVKIQALCESSQTLEETNENVNIIDYECIGNDSEQKIGDNYKLNLIENGDNDGITINDKLKELNNKINDCEKSASSYNNSNMVIFVVDDKDIKDKSSLNNKFEFSLDGKIKNNQKIYSNCINNIKVEMYNMSETANFTFCTNDSKNGRLDVLLDINDEKDEKVISFGNSEIEIEKDIPMYVPALNKIKLNYQYSEPSNEPGTSRYYSSSNSKTVIIVICLVVGFVILGTATGFLLWLRKSKKTNGINLRNNGSIDTNPVYNNSSGVNFDKNG